MKASRICQFKLKLKRNLAVQSTFFAKRASFNKYVGMGLGKKELSKRQPEGWVEFCKGQTWDPPTK